MGLYLEAGKLRYPLSQCQLNDIINVSRDGVEVEGDAFTSLCEVDTLVGAKDDGRLDFVVTCRNDEADTQDIIREFGIRKGLKKLVISSKIRIFIGENQ